jgi:hypothetical protein
MRSIDCVARQCTRCDANSEQRFGLERLCVACSSSTPATLKFSGRTHLPTETLQRNRCSWHQLSIATTVEPQKVRRIPAVPMRDQATAMLPELPSPRRMPIVHHGLQAVKTILGLRRQKAIIDQIAIGWAGTTDAASSLRHHTICTSLWRWFSLISVARFIQTSHSTSANRTSARTKRD